MAACEAVALEVTSVTQTVSLWLPPYLPLFGAGAQAYAVVWSPSQGSPLSWARSPASWDILLTCPPTSHTPICQPLLLHVQTSLTFLDLVLGEIGNLGFLSADGAGIEMCVPV